MDAIFVKCHSYLSVVKIAKDEPRRYGKNGELLIAYEETEEHQRRISVLGNRSGKEKLEAMEKRRDGELEKGLKEL